MRCACQTHPFLVRRSRLMRGQCRVVSSRVVSHRPSWSWRSACAGNVPFKLLRSKAASRSSEMTYMYEEVANKPLFELCRNLTAWLPFFWVLSRLDQRRRRRRMRQRASLLAPFIADRQASTATTTHKKALIPTATVAACTNTPVATAAAAAQFECDRRRTVFLQPFFDVLHARALVHLGRTSGPCSLSGQPISAAVARLIRRIGASKLNFIERINVCECVRASCATNARVSLPPPRRRALNFLIGRVYYAQTTGEHTNILRRRGPPPLLCCVAVAEPFDRQFVSGGDDDDASKASLYIKSLVSMAMC